MKLQSCLSRITMIVLVFYSFSAFSDNRLDKLADQLEQLSFHSVSKFKTTSLAKFSCQLHKSKKINLHHIIEAQSSKFNVPAEVISAIMAIESNFNPCAISKSGAIGLMQLMPKTAKSFGINTKSGKLFDITTNIRGGVEVLAANLKQENDNLLSAIVMYNAGSKYLSLNWSQWQKETQNHIGKFSKEIEKINRIGWKRRVPHYISSVVIKPCPI